VSARVLVTGATGFVGRHALPALAGADAEVHAVARRAGTGAAGIAWHEADILDRAAMRALVDGIRPTHVLHAAWFVEHGAFWASPMNVDWVAATLDLARLAAEAGCGRFVGVGTCVEYDWSDGGPGLRREADHVAPTHFYGVAKDATRAVLEGLGRQTGMATAWGRLFHLFGPAENPRRLVASLFEALRAGRPAELASGRPVRDFLCTVEAGRALAALCLSDVAGPVNVASGQGIAIADLARDIARLAGKPELLRLGARPDPAGEAPRMVADVSRLRDEVGFVPSASREEWLERLWLQPQDENA
jgi:nucleoside-diphosphate-sugar epimerase